MLEAALYLDEMVHRSAMVTTAIVFFYSIHVRRDLFFILFVILHLLIINCRFHQLLERFSVNHVPLTKIKVIRQKKSCYN